MTQVRNQSSSNIELSKKLVSVIIPMYNSAKWIETCLNSICSQSYRHLEILVVDDGSTDNGAEIVQSFTQADNRVQLISHAQNMGLFQARLTGFRASHGDYIAFVDADDKISIDWFRLLLQTAEANHNDITIGQFYLYNENGLLEKLNLDPLRQKLLLEGDEVFRAIYGASGCMLFLAVGVE